MSLLATRVGDIDMSKVFSMLMSVKARAGFGAVDPEIAWAKLGALKEGARRAG